jgi:hypothetical protein
MTSTRPRAVLAIAVLSAAGVAAGISQVTRPTSPSHAHPTRAGAVRAAVAALYQLSIPAVLSRATFEDAVRRLAAPGARQRIEATFGAAEPTLTSAFRRSPRLLRGAPLGYRVDRFTSTEASIAIWTVAIAASPRFEAAAQWRTLLIDLVWTHGRWRVSDGSGIDGPDPSTPLPRLAAEAARFRRLTYVP